MGGRQRTTIFMGLEEKKSEAKGKSEKESREEKKQKKG